MTKRRTSRSLLHIGVTAVLWCGAAGAPAIAGEACVTCAEPAAVYRCALEGPDVGQAAEPGVQLLCITVLAKRGGHKSCSIDSTAAAAPCNGALVTLARPPAGTTVPAASEAAATGGPAGPAPPASAPSKAPPATVEALAKDAAEQTKKDWEKTKSTVNETASSAGQEIKKAGSTVGAALKNSWDCLASLFSKC